MANQPDYNVYTVLGKGKDAYWLKLGAAFMNQDGEGYSVVLQALPITNADGQCKIVLRRPKQKGEEVYEKT